MLNKITYPFQMERYQISLEENLCVFILSRNPITVEGIKSFLGKYITAENLIISACSENCENRLKNDCQQCFNCQSFESLKREKNSVIRIIDDYDFFASLAHYLSRKEIDHKTIVYTGNNNVLYLKHIIDKRVNGLIHKTSPKKNILKAIECVSLGAVYIDTQINSLISENINYQNNYPLTNLTYRQIEILYLISIIYKNNQIAQKLNITIGTVEKHKENIKDILNMNSVNELNTFADNHRNEIRFMLEFTSGKK